MTFKKKFAAEKLVHARECFSIWVLCQIDFLQSNYSKTCFLVQIKFITEDSNQIHNEY